MNETGFVEASRCLAERVMREVRTGRDEQLARAFQIVMNRMPCDDELRILRAGYNKHLKHYQLHLAEAEKLIAVGEKPRDQSLDAAEFAAFTVVANLILNLDEAITQH
jgi:hypothetical protein